MVNSIALAIGELSGLVREWIKSSPTRHMKNAIRNAEKYIKTNQSATLSKDGKEKLLKRYEKRFNKYKLG